MTANGFIDEFNKLSALFSKKKEPKVYTKQFKKELERPFGASRPWKGLKKWQKARIGAGTALNLAWAVPLLYGQASSLGRKITGKKDPAKKQLADLKRKMALQDQAKKIVRYA